MGDTENTLCCLEEGSYGQATTSQSCLSFHTYKMETYNARGGWEGWLTSLHSVGQGAPKPTDYGIEQKLQKMPYRELPLQLPKCPSKQTHLTYTPSKGRF